MSKLLSRSKHEEFESNSSLQIRSQKERRVKSEGKWSIAKFGSCSTVHSSITIHPTAPVLLHFMLLLFLLKFFVSSHFVLVIAFSFSFFFFKFPLALSIYKPQFVQNDQSFHFGNGRWAVVSSLLPPFSHFLSFSLPFSATKHSFEDDNSKDGWLDLFLLEEEGCWLGFEVN